MTMILVVMWSNADVNNNKDNSFSFLCVDTFFISVVFIFNSSPEKLLWNDLINQEKKSSFKFLHTVLSCLIAYCNRTYFLCKYNVLVSMHTFEHASL